MCAIRTHPSASATSHLVTSPPALGDHLGHLVHLSLRTTECPEPLLRKLSRALVLAVAEQLDNTALVWCEAVRTGMLVRVCDAICKLLWSAYPETSFTTSLTNAVLLLK